MQLLCLGYFGSRCLHGMATSTASTFISALGTHLTTFDRRIKCRGPHRRHFNRQRRPIRWNRFDFGVAVCRGVRLKVCNICADRRRKQQAWRMLYFCVDLFEPRWALVEPGRQIMRQMGRRTTEVKLPSCGFGFPSSAPPQPPSPPCSTQCCSCIVPTT